jgi:tetratricopeptide (TPR) repeat protein
MRFFQLDFMFGDPQTLSDRLTAALAILDQVGADHYEYAQVHQTAAAMAAVFGNLDLARQEAEVALGISRRLGNASTIAISLYAFGLAFLASDRSAARAALEEYLQLVHAAGYDVAVARVLALALHAQLLATDRNLPAAVEALREGLQSAHINGDRPAMAACVARGALVLAACGELENAAVFVGAVTDGSLARLGAVPPHELAEYHQFSMTVRSELGDDRNGGATARGATMSYEQIAAFALDAVKHLRSTVDTSS